MKYLMIRLAYDYHDVIIDSIVPFSNPLYFDLEDVDFEIWELKGSRGYIRNNEIMDVIRRTACKSELKNSFKYHINNLRKYKKQLIENTHILENVTSSEETMDYFKRRDNELRHGIDNNTKAIISDRRSLQILRNNIKLFTTEMLDEMMEENRELMEMLSEKKKD